MDIINCHHGLLLSGDSKVCTILTMTTFFVGFFGLYLSYFKVFVAMGVEEAKRPMNIYLRGLTPNSEGTNMYVTLAPHQLWKSSNELS
jgi:hypothetical protein